MRISSALISLSVLWVTTAGAATVKIAKTGDGFELLRDGKPYFIKGGSGASRHLDALVEAGGNSIRSFGGSAVLDPAREKGLTVLVGLRVGVVRQGFDYNDAARVRKQREDAVATVRQFKDHPAVLMWALGNEVELGISEAQRMQVWKALEELARAVKAEDPNHPVIAVLAGAGKTKLKELEEHCPTLDAVGINAYGGMLGVPETVAAQGWKKAYVITEFGPRGHWEVSKTPWGLPIEDTSTEKAGFYRKAYEHTVGGRPQCLGAYVFLWGQKQEKTHTWYGMFMPEGNKLNPVDTMQYVWTGKWPANRCPLTEGRIQTKADVLPVGAAAKFSIAAKDPDGDPITVKWDLRPDVSDNPSTGGDREPPTLPIEGAVLSSKGLEAEIRMPDKPGNYRVFVYVSDPQGAMATANLPVQVK